MARMPRLVVPHFPHHITQRGNRRQNIFFCVDDYRYYLELISHFSCKARTEVWAYCLMPNHVHLIMVPTYADGLWSALGEAHRSYTRHINFREGWRGHLWQERFHSFAMDERHLMAAVRYVELNPVTAGLCRFPQDWKWSSARAHLQAQDDGLVKVKPMLDRVRNWSEYLSGRTLDADVALIRQHARTGRPLGGLEFIQNLEKLTGCDFTPKCPGRKPTTC